MKQVKFLFVLVFLGFFVACQGPYHKPEKKPMKIGIKELATSESDDAEEEKEEVPVDMDNKGVGPITNVELGESIDQDMAAAGEAYFNSVCIACHQIDNRMVGPALRDIMDRRAPEWIMNMILNTNEMLEEDPIAKALLDEYQAPMTYMGTTEDEARELVEYFRTVSK